MIPAEVEGFVDRLPSRPALTPRAARALLAIIKDAEPSVVLRVVRGDTSSAS